VPAARSRRELGRQSVRRPVVAAARLNGGNGVAAAQEAGNVEDPTGR